MSAACFSLSLSLSIILITFHYHSPDMHLHAHNKRVFFSGGHLNPAVSLSVYLCGGLDLILLLPYVLAQMIGAMIGAGLAKVRKSQTPESNNYRLSRMSDITDSIRYTLSIIYCLSFLNIGNLPLGGVFCFLWRSLQLDGNLHISG